MFVDSFTNRLKKAMNIRKLRQVDLVNRTKQILKDEDENYDGCGIDKTLLNKYLKGIATAKSENINLLAKALNVNESWLMGLDVPMNRNTDWKEYDETHEKEINQIKQDIKVLEKLNLNPNDIDELDQLLFSKAKELSDDEKKVILDVMKAIHKDVDKELDN